MIIRTVIVDDEQGARETLIKMLQLYCSNVEVIAEAEGVEEGLKVINKTQPDLIFLDIKMHDGSGFDLLRKFHSIEFKVIFVTAFDEFAINAIKFSAMDYLLKPVDPNDLKAATRKVSQAIEQEILNLKINTLFHNIERENKKITLKTSESFHIILVNDIIRCEAEGNYTTFFLLNGNKILVSTTLKDYEDILSSYKFFRTHQSHLINLNHVCRFDKKNGGSLIMKDNSNIPVSVRKKERLIQLLEEL